MSIHNYATNADSNTSVGDGAQAVSVAEGMARGDVNNAMRAMAADSAKHYKDCGELVSMGTGNALEITTFSDITALVAGLHFTFKIHAMIEAGATLNLNGIGARAIYLNTPSGLVAMEANIFPAGSYVQVVYDGTHWVCVNGSSRLYVDLASASAVAAALEADRAEAAQVGAEAAQVGAEAARDQAIVNSSEMYADTTAGLAATVDGDFFTILSPADDGYVDLYKNVAAAAVYQDTMPNANQVRRPSRTGKINGWPDTFFRHLKIGGSLLGKERWKGTNFKWTLSANTLFDGNAIRRTEVGSSSHYLAGPRLYLSDIGAEVGDTITIRALVVGDGAYAVIAGRPLNSLGGTIDTQKNAVDDTGTAGSFVTTADPARQTISFVVPSGMDSFWFYPYCPNLGAGTHWEIAALWFYKGVPADGPAWPDFTSDTYVEKSFLLAESDTSLDQRMTREEDVTDYIFTRSATVVGDSSTINLEVTNPSPNAIYGATFEGWGERYVPAGISFNTIRARFVGRKADVVEANFWQNLKVVIRTGANSHQAGATVVAVGESLVSPNQETLIDTDILLKRPVSGEVITLSDSDFIGGEYFIGLHVEGAEGAIAYMSPHRAEQSNSLPSPQSYYITTGDPEADGWLPFSGNWRLGVDHILVTNPREAESYTPTSDFLADMTGQVAARGAIANAERMQNLAARVARGQAVTMGLFGDSWTQTAFRIHTPLSSLIADSLGVSAQGYISASGALAAVSGVNKSRTGTWTDVRYPTEHIEHPGGGYGPEGEHAITTDVAATFSVSRTDGSVAKHRIHYVQQTNGGTFSYSVGGGAATNVDTSGGTAYQTIDVVGSGAFSFDMVSAGTDGVILCGVEVLNETAGQAVLHKLGNGGADAARFTAIPEAYFEAACAAMQLDVAMILLGTNDHSYDIPPTTFKNSMKEIADRIKAARPLCDIALVGAGPNGSTGNPYTIKELNDQLFELAEAEGWAFLDLEAFFGTYAEANSRGLYGDIFHPNSDGGLVIGKAIYRSILADHI